MDWVSFILYAEAVPDYEEFPLGLVPMEPGYYLWAERQDLDQPATEPTVLSDPEMTAVNAVAVCGKTRDGRRRGPIDMALYEGLRPLGNDPENGEATSDLPDWSFFGTKQILLGDESEVRVQQEREDVLALYPVDNAPFAGQLEYVLADGVWNWLFKIVDGEDNENRDIANFSIQVIGTQRSYPLNQSLGFWAATGDDDWSEPQPVTLAMRQGGNDQGQWTLTPEASGIVRLFWRASQG
jgi:hypothetical protein